ncbi:DNA polymerase III subunit epsilon [Oecophyllibacter saccharovorans]|uniref:DNA polymerase III subunit epsilon n=1 Tax=Oecophyllibacter saccharovorans TaxID=2558360 RepID=UPI00114261AE|nr:DNA polymerase III subunit epsilon [Oecophyllibacter saccharovorans]QDH14578.1 DNA polymerase III subunit epsilon [Oecophyllibacter saccharovorans]TPW34777.1 DNA polymerase III subunit epsilon [Oecophyllibacter saccharovorans]
MTRTILFDTETTGFDPDQGDRILEIAALELENELPTGRHFHVVIDPERPIPPDATRIHGFTDNDVRGKPKFAEIAEDFLAFVGDCRMIAHNATFDFRFINAELERCGQPTYDYDSRAIDTVLMARRKYPGLPASLDALCRRFGIDLSARGTHNALLDCQLLAQVYVELIGGRQRGLGLEANRREQEAQATTATRRVAPDRRPRPMPMPSQDLLQRHAAFLKTVTDPIWERRD